MINASVDIGRVASNDDYLVAGSLVDLLSRAVLGYGKRSVRHDGSERSGRWGR